MAIEIKMEGRKLLLPLVDYRHVISELKAVKSSLDEFLERGKAQIHKNMWEVSPGIWINNEYKSLSECLFHLRTLLPS